MRSRTSRRFCLYLTTLVTTALALSACGSGDDTSDEDTNQAANSSTASGNDWDDIVAAANEEGHLLMYAGRIEETVNPLVEAFNARYPDIEVEYIRSATAELLQRYDNETASDNVQVSILWGAAESRFVQMRDKGQILEPQGPETENWDEADYAGGIVRAVVDPYVLAYNPDLVTEPPTDWCEPESLLSPDLAAAYQEPLTPGSALATVMMADSCGEDGLEARAQQRVQVATSAIPLTAAVGSGEVSQLVIGGFPWVIQAEVDRGAPIEYVLPASGAPALESQMVAVANAPAPNAALVWLDFIMSEEAQKIITEETGPATSVLPGVGNLDIDVEQLTPVPTDAAEAERLLAEAADILAGLQG